MIDMVCGITSSASACCRKVDGFNVPTATMSDATLIVWGNILAKKRCKSVQYTVRTLIKGLFDCKDCVLEPLDLLKSLALG